MRMIRKWVPVSDNVMRRKIAMAEIEPKRHDELTADVEAATASHTGIIGRIRNYFLTGLVVAGPLSITA